MEKVEVNCQSIGLLHPFKPESMLMVFWLQNDPIRGFKDEARRYLQAQKVACDDEAKRIKQRRLKVCSAA